jgi:hypothetical protein
VTEVRACLVILAVVTLFAGIPAAASGQASAVPVVPVSLKRSAAAPIGPGLNRAFPADLVAAARTFLGVPYVHGGDSRQGVDCSGLVYRVFHDLLGMDLSRGVEGLFRTGLKVQSPLHVGDLLFFDTDETPPLTTPTHVGIYAGGGRFVHAASEGSKTGVIVSELASPYYRDRFIGARRVYPWRPPMLPLTVTDDTTKSRDADPFPSKEPVTIQILNGMSGGGPLDLAVLRDGKVVLSRRITPGAQKPAEVTITPDKGSWSVRVSRIFKGRELAELSFTVEE